MISLLSPRLLAERYAQANLAPWTDHLVGGVALAGESPSATGMSAFHAGVGPVQVAWFVLRSAVVGIAGRGGDLTSTTRWNRRHSSCPDLYWFGSAQVTSLRQRRSGQWDSLRDYPIRGSVTEKMAPPWDWFCAVMVPPWASTMVRAIDKPMPIPAGFIEKNGSNICCKCSPEIPEPVSDVENSARSSERRVRMVMIRS